jgi:hypothetical protein
MIPFTQFTLSALSLCFPNNSLHWGLQLVGLAEADPTLPGGMSSKGSKDLLNTMLSVPTQPSQGGSQVIPPPLASVINKQTT